MLTVFGHDYSISVPVWLNAKNQNQRDTIIPTGRYERNWSCCVALVVGWRLEGSAVKLKPDGGRCEITPTTVEDLLGIGNAKRKGRWWFSAFRGNWIRMRGFGFAA